MSGRVRDLVHRVGFNAQLGPALLLHEPRGRWGLAVTSMVTGAGLYHATSYSQATMRTAHQLRLVDWADQYTKITKGATGLEAHYRARPGSLDGQLVWLLDPGWDAFWADQAKRFRNPRPADWQAPAVAR